MSAEEDKNLQAPAESDGVARARLYGHLAFRGYIVTESDELGPVKILVNSMGLQEWHRDSIEGYKSGKRKGGARDYWMRFVSQQDWQHE